MNNSPSRSSDDEVFALLVLGVLGMGAVGGVLAATWNRALGWLLEHQVVVAAAAHPLLALPRSAGAGLDLPRLALAVAVLLLLAAAAVGAVRRRMAFRVAAGRGL